MSGNSAYLTGLDRNQANYTPLTPLTFLERAAHVYPDHPSVVYRVFSAIPGVRLTHGAVGWRRLWRGGGSARTIRSR